MAHPMRDDPPTPRLCSEPARCCLALAASLPSGDRKVSRQITMKDTMPAARMVKVSESAAEIDCNLVVAFRGQTKRLAVGRAEQCLDLPATVDCVRGF